MPAALTYPGVYIEEIPSGVRTITGVATSIAAFVGRARRGPVNEAVTINSFGDFERIFGGLWVDSPLGFAVRDFYLNGGSQAIIVRLFHPYFPTEADRTAALAAANGVADEAAATAATVGKKAAEVAAAATTKADATPAGPGKTAADTVADAAKKAAVQPGAALAAVLASAQAVAAAAATAEAATAVATAAAVLAAPDPAAAAAVLAANAIDVANAASTEASKPANAAEPLKTATKRVADAAQAASIKPGATAALVKTAADNDVQDAAKAAVAAAAAKAAVGVAAPLTKARLSVNGLTLEATNEGAWGNSLRARVDHDVKGPSAADLFNLSIRDGTTGVVEVFRNVAVVTGHVRQVDMVLLNESKLVRAPSLPPNRPGKHADPKLGQELWGDPKPPEFPDVTNSKVANADQSSDGSGLGGNDFTGPGKETAKQGLYALEQADLFNLLCIPPYKNSDVEPSLVATAAAYCEKRRAMLLVDPPSGWKDKDKAKSEFNADPDKVGTRSNYAALFFPRLKQPNPEKDNQVEEFVPCGAVAGIFARTDTQRGVWKAPAGLEATLVGVPQLSVSLTDAENGELNPLGINCLRALPAAGRVVWGARTLQGDDRLASEWKYIPVRRVALFIEESLYRGIKWVVFEPNDEPLWAQIRLNVGAFMHNLFRQGAFQGKTPREAYFVKCDRETTTQNDINLGIVNIVVGFAPLKPAEFVVLKIQQMAGQIET